MYCFVSTHTSLIKSVSSKTNKPLPRFLKRFYGAAEKKERDKKPSGLTPQPLMAGITKTKGFFSERTKSKIRSKIYAFCMLCMLNKKNINFITLTFPQGTSEQDAKEILNTWLTRVRFYVESRASNNVFNYLWVSELQKNGTMHFHLLTDCFLNVVKVQNFLNVSISNKICQNAKTQIISQSQQRFLHNVNTGTSPSGLDIQSVKYYDTRKVTAYISKYVTKMNAQTTIQGAVWNCSQSISALYTGVGLTEQEVDAFYYAYIENVDKETGECIFYDKEGKALQGKNYKINEYFECFCYVKPPPFVCDILAEENAKKLKHPENMFDMEFLQKTA